MNALSGNARKEEIPIFHNIFGESWYQLPPVMHHHYANRPFSNDRVVVEGRMDIEVSAYIKLLSPLLAWLGVLVPYAAKNVPVTVTFRSEPHSSAFIFDRIFYLPGRAPYHFYSRMIPAGENRMVEWTAAGIGWCAAYRFQQGKVKLEHCGYRVKGVPFRLPLEWVCGKGYAEEEALNENSFRMRMEMRHAVFGTVYGYSGEFRITEMSLA
jgi:hypothetical protein